MEWKNAGFYNEGDSLGTLNDYINFQLWLYEGSNNIEIHFGTNMITNPAINYYGETGAIVGLSDYNRTNTYLLSGSPSNPIVADLVFLNGTPTDGTIYKFSKSTTGIDLIKSNNFNVQVYPNPFHRYVTFNINNGELHNAELTVTDILGRPIKTISNIQTNKIIVECNNLVKGIYFYNLTEKAKTIATGKLIIE